MAKYLQKKKKNPLWWILAAVIVVLVIAAVVFLPKALNEAPMNGETGTSQTDAPLSVTTVPSGDTAPPATVTNPTVSTAPALSFPLQAADGRLVIDSLFQYSGINPDCDNREGENIAAITLKNVSDQYLAEAKLTLTLPDGTLLNFAVTELPAGASVMAFCAENQSIPQNAACIQADCEASFDPAAAAVSDQVTATVSGVQITLTNTSGQDISQIVVYCRSPLGEAYFGGITYSYIVTNLPAGESTVVMARDCILGIAEVVRLAVN